MILFFNILAWAWLAFMAVGVAAGAYVSRRGYTVEPHIYVYPVTLAAVAWLVSRLFV